MSRELIGKIGEFYVYSDTLCPKDSIYMLPEKEVVVPSGYTITESLEKWVKDMKDRMGRCVWFTPKEPTSSKLDGGNS